jgi:ParB family chromosome partitioning protein
VLSLTDPRDQEAFFQEIVGKGLSVREAEKRASTFGTQKATKSPRKGLIPELNAMEERFISRLGTKVVISGDLNKGSIVIDYYSMEDLDRLYQLLGRSGE